jgi:hypothetical protein
MQEHGKTEATWKIEEEIPLSRLWISGSKVNEFLTEFLRPPELPLLNNFQTKLNVEKQFSSEEENQKRFAFFQHSLQDKQRLKNVWKPGNVLSLLIQDPRTIKFSSSSSTSSSSSCQLLECPKSFQWLKRSANSICWEKQLLQQLEPQIPTNKRINQSYHSQKFMKWNQVTNKAKQLFVNPSTIIHSSDSKDKRINNPADLSVNSSSENTSFQSVIPVLIIHQQQQQQQKQCQSSSFAVESNTNNKPFFNHSNETPAGLQSSFVLIVPTSYLKILWNEIFLKRKKEMINLGVEEMSFIHRLKGELHFPNDYLNTSAGWNHWEKEIFEKKLLKKELLKPKNKRANLNNFSIKRFPELLLTAFSDLSMANTNNNDEEEEVYIMNEEGMGNELENDDNNQQEEENDGNSKENPPNEQKGQEQQPGNDQEKPFHERFQIVYERNYYSEVIPPKYIPVAVSSSSHDSLEHNNNHSSELKILGGISHCLQHRDWSLPSFEKNEFIPLLPPVSLPTFIYISLVPHSRGLPRSGAFLYLPTREEIEEFIKHQIHTKLLFSESPSVVSSTTTELNRDYIGKWKGIYQKKKNNQEKERVFLGMVVNGFHPRTNTRIGCSHRSSAMALVNINLLNAFMAEYYGRYSHPLSHLMILFQNDQSKWMRPAIYDFL